MGCLISKKMRVEKKKKVVTENRKESNGKLDQISNRHSETDSYTCIRIVLEIPDNEMNDGITLSLKRSNANESRENVAVARQAKLKEEKNLKKNETLDEPNIIDGNYLEVQISDSESNTISKQPLKSEKEYNSLESGVINDSVVIVSEQNEIKCFYIADGEENGKKYSNIDDAGGQNKKSYSYISDGEDNEKKCFNIAACEVNVEKCSNIAAGGFNEKKRLNIDIDKENEMECFNIGAGEENVKKCSNITAGGQNEKKRLNIDANKENETECSNIDTGEENKKKCTNTDAGEETGKKCSNTDSFEEKEMKCSNTDAGEENEKNCSNISTDEDNEKKFSYVDAGGQNEMKCLNTDAGVENEMKSLKVDAGEKNEKKLSNTDAGVETEMTSLKADAGEKNEKKLSYVDAGVETEMKSLKADAGEKNEKKLSNIDAGVEAEMKSLKADAGEKNEKKLSNIDAGVETEMKSLKADAGEKNEKKLSNIDAGAETEKKCSIIDSGEENKMKCLNMDAGKENEFNFTNVNAGNENEKKCTNISAGEDSVKKYSNIGAGGQNVMKYFSNDAGNGNEKKCSNIDAAEENKKKSSNIVAYEESEMKCHNNDAGEDNVKKYSNTGAGGQNEMKSLITDAGKENERQRSYIDAGEDYEKNFSNIAAGEQNKIKCLEIDAGEENEKNCSYISADEDNKIKFFNMAAGEENEKKLSNIAAFEKLSMISKKNLSLEDDLKRKSNVSYRRQKPKNMRSKFDRHCPILSNKEYLQSNSILHSDAHMNESKSSGTGTERSDIPIAQDLKRSKASRSRENIAGSSQDKSSEKSNLKKNKIFSELDIDSGKDIDIYCLTSGIDGTHIEDTGISEPAVLTKSNNLDKIDDHNGLMFFELDKRNSFHSITKGQISHDTVNQNLLAVQLKDAGCSGGLGCVFLYDGITFKKFANGTQPKYDQYIFLLKSHEVSGNDSLKNIGISLRFIEDRPVNLTADTTLQAQGLMVNNNNSEQSPTFPWPSVALDTLDRSGGNTISSLIGFSLENDMTLKETMSAKLCLFVQNGSNVFSAIGTDYISTRNRQQTLIDIRTQWEAFYCVSIADRLGIKLSNNKTLSGLLYCCQIEVSRVYKCLNQWLSSYRCQVERLADCNEIFWDQRTNGGSDDQRLVKYRLANHKVISHKTMMKNESHNYEIAISSDEYSSQLSQELVHYKSRKTFLELDCSTREGRRIYDTWHIMIGLYRLFIFYLLTAIYSEGFEALRKPRINVVRMEYFESAMRESARIQTQLTFTNIYILDNRIPTAVPIYVYGLIHRKDLLRQA